MNLKLWPTVDFINEEELSGKTVVVIDVLRATSVITTALANGASEVIVKVEVEEAIELKDDETLVGGERRALKIKGFDLSNSPLEYSREIVENKRIVLTTTNGTKTIHRAALADKIYIGSMINGRAVANALAGEGKDIIIACAGTQGDFSLDDFICAGKIIYDVLNIHEISMDDFAASAYMAYRDNKNDIISYIKMASHYKYLISIGLEKDIDYCFTEDIIKIVPAVKNGVIK
jgi:2-phosphosulfolactate phosphatase